MKLSDAFTLVETLRLRSEKQGDDIAYSFLRYDGRPDQKITYAELDRKARALAVHIRRYCARNDRVLLLYPSGLEYFCAFMGCVYADVIAVPLFPPHSNRDVPRLQIVVDDGEAVLALTQGDLSDHMIAEGIVNEKGLTIKTLATDRLSLDIYDDWSDPGLKKEHLAYLQYTSGSTGSPKGVMVTHQNLMFLCRFLAGYTGLTTKDAVGHWLPLWHDYGLIYGMIFPLVCGGTCYQLTPDSFVKQPFRWLNMLSQYRVSNTAAPNFAFELCLRKVSEAQRDSLDLSCLKTTGNAAEPVRANTIRRFAEYFEPCGFKLESFAPSYGLAEATLYLSANPVGVKPIMVDVDARELEQGRVVPVDQSHPNGTTVVGCGAYDASTRPVIVNPKTLIQAEPDQVGEIWTRGEAVAEGYWRKGAQTKETFGAYLADSGEGPFLRSGDLGFFIDKELFIAGRLKDIIIIRGRNHYPQDIEYTVSKASPLFRPGCSAAFSIEHGKEEKLVVVQELYDHAIENMNADEIFGLVRQELAVVHYVTLYAVYFIRQGTILKTSSGKIQRRLTNARLQAGQLKIIASWKDSQAEASTKPVKEISEDELRKSGKQLTTQLTPASNHQRVVLLRERLRELVSQVLGLNSTTVKNSEGFFALGMDSLRSLELRNRLEVFFDRKLPPTLAFDYPTVDALGHYLLPKILDIKEVTEPESGEVPVDHELENLLNDIDDLSDDEVLENISGD